jgi:hypothetical protein
MANYCRAVTKSPRGTGGLQGKGWQLEIGMFLYEKINFSNAFKFFEILIPRT